MLWSDSVFSLMLAEIVRQFNSTSNKTNRSKLSLSIKKLFYFEKWVNLFLDQTVCTSPSLKNGTCSHFPLFLLGILMLLDILTIRIIVFFKNFFFFYDIIFVTPKKKIKKLSSFIILGFNFFEIRSLVLEKRRTWESIDDEYQKFQYPVTVA